MYSMNRNFNSNDINVIDQDDINEELKEKIINILVPKIEKTAINIKKLEKKQELVIQYVILFLK